MGEKRKHFFLICQNGCNEITTFKVMQSMKFSPEISLQLNKLSNWDDRPNGTQKSNLCKQFTALAAGKTLNQ